MKAGFKELSQTGLKIWANSFYRHNTGFFVLAGLLFSIVFSGGGLLALAELAVHDAGILAIGFFIPSLLYEWKVASWGLRLIRSAEYEFFRSILFVPQRIQLKMLLLFHAALLAPVLPFAGLLLQQAIRFHCINTLGLLCFFLVGLLFLPLPFWKWAIQKPADFSISHSASDRSIPFLKGTSGWLLRHLLQHELMLLIWTKVLSLLVVVGSMVLYSSDDYDQRLLSLAWLAAGFLHLGFLKEAAKLEFNLAFLRNLPLAMGKRIGWQVSLILPILLPEILVFLRNCPEETGWFYRLSAPFFFISLVLFLRQTELLFNRFPGRDVQLIPAVFFGLSLAIMFSVPAALLSLMLFSMAIWLHHFFYFKAETSVPE